MPGGAVSDPGCRQGAKQSAHSVPKNLDADANEEKGREPQDDAHPAFADDRGETIGEAVAKIDAHRDERRTNHRGENLEEVRTEMVRLVCAESDGHGDGTRPNRERGGEKVEGAWENIGGIHFFLHLWPAVQFLFAF